MSPRAPPESLDVAVEHWVQCGRSARLNLYEPSLLIVLTGKIAWNSELVNRDYAIKLIDEMCFGLIPLRYNMRKSAVAVTERSIMQLASTDERDRARYLGGQLTDQELEQNDRKRQELLLRYLDSKIGHAGGRYVACGHRDVEEAIWALAMHSDSVRIMTMAFRLLASSCSDRTSLAFLCDRILVMRGRSQVFCTQTHLCVKGIRLWPHCHERKFVDALRQELGLESVSVYLAHIKGRYAGLRQARS
jgi:hypothetical protein